MKKGLSMILSLLLVVGFCVPVLAVEPAEDGFDTLSISMEEYYVKYKTSQYAPSESLRQ